MRGRGIDHPGRIAVDHGDRLARGIIGQAENGDVGFVQRVAPRRRVLARLAGQMNQVQFGAGFQPLADLQPGGPLFAVDEYGVCHVRCLFASQCSTDPGGIKKGRPRRDALEVEVAVPALSF